MTPQNLPEAKRAWLITEMIEELNQLLWNHYEEEFITFLLEEDPPYYQSLLSEPKQDNPIFFGEEKTPPRHLNPD